jgi:GT2 family glycosyltransferase
MISIVQSVYSNNNQFKNSLLTCFSSIESLNIPFQYIIFNDKGDKDIINFIPQHILNHPNFKYHYSDVNYGLNGAPGGMVGGAKLVKHKYVHQINEDDFYTPSFYSLSIKHLESLDGSYAGICSNCYHVDEEFEITKIAFPLQGEGINKAWSNPTIMFNSIFNPKNKKLITTNNFLYNPGTIFKSELYKKIGLPDIESYGGCVDFEYWTRCIFNGFKFKYLSLPTWSYMKSSSSLSTLANNSSEDLRKTVYNPRILKTYQKLWENNNYKLK